MDRNQAVGIVWVVMGVIYGGIGAIVQEQMWWSIGAIVYALVAVTTPIWSKWLPDGSKQ